MASLRVEQLTEQLVELAALELHQLPVAVPCRQLQGLLQAAQCRLLVAAVALQRSVEQK
ncbi:hypothetical protein D3C75_1360370 [compost metagenome]